jgi:hypothetical protein
MHIVQVSCFDLQVEQQLAKEYGGETGIRTLDTLRYTRFPSVRLQPLGHLSAVLRASLNLTQLAPDQRRCPVASGAQGACAVMFCFTIAEDFKSTGAPCIR